MGHKLVIIISTIYVVFMAALSTFYLTNDESFKALVSIGGVICGAVPLLLALFTKLSFNLPLTFSYLAFLFCSQYLGSILGWYSLGWWDTLMHVLSGIILAFVGIALFERFIPKVAARKISPWFVFLFTFSIAGLGGVLWEIYEFSSDQWFNMTLQGGGNRDTMIDFIADLGGGLLVAIWAGVRSKLKIGDVS
ncbi:MAG TPA: hypothetical protein VEY51_10465 [Chondromyces sp.]|nr:hypothetical protein [Chondromyces sp.]